MKGNIMIIDFTESNERNEPTDDLCGMFERCPTHSDEKSTTVHCDLCPFYSYNIEHDMSNPFEEFKKYSFSELKTILTETLPESYIGTQIEYLL